MDDFKQRIGVFFMVLSIATFAMAFLYAVDDLTRLGLFFLGVVSGLWSLRIRRATRGEGEGSGRFRTFRKIKDRGKKKEEGE
jgi:hypothetical protein